MEMKTSCILTARNISRQQKWGQTQERKTPGKDKKKGSIKYFSQNTRKIERDKNREILSLEKQKDLKQKVKQQQTAVWN